MSNQEVASSLADRYLEWRKQPQLVNGITLKPLSDKSKGFYESHLRQFAQYCDRRGVSLTGNLTQEAIDFLTESGFARKTAEVKLSVIFSETGLLAFLNKEDDRQITIDKNLLRQKVNALEGPKYAPPVSEEQILEIYNALRKSETPYFVARNILTVSFMYHAGLSPQRLSDAHESNFQVSRKEASLESRSHKFSIPITGDNEEIGEYKRLRADFDGDPNNPYLLLNKTRGKLSTRSIRRIVRDTGVAPEADIRSLRASSSLINK